MMAIGGIDILQVEGLTNNLADLQTEIDDHEARVDNPHGVTVTQIGAIPESEKGAPNGIASLDSNSKIPASQIPALSLERITVVPDENIRFALTINDVQNGDIVKQSDNGWSYVVSDDTQLDSEAGYTPLVSPSAAPVDSVFGRIGIVEATAGDYTSDQIDNTSSINGGAGSVSDVLETNANAISSHVTDTSNPHGVTAADVGAPTVAEVNNLLSDVSNLSDGSVGNAEFGHLSGVTSNIQDQLDDLTPPATLDLAPTGTINGTNRDFLLQSEGADVAFSSLDSKKVDVYVKRLWQIPEVDYTIIDNGSGSAMIRFADGQQPLSEWPLHTRGVVG